MIFDTALTPVDSFYLDTESEELFGFHQFADSLIGIIYRKTYLAPNFQVIVQMFYKVYSMDGTLISSQLIWPEAMTTLGMFRPEERTAQSPDGSIFAGFTRPYGTVNSNAYEFDPINRPIFLVKLLPNGEIAWRQTFGGDANYLLTSINADSAGNCIAVGTYYDWQNNPDGVRKLFILKLDPDGNVLTSTHEDLLHPTTTPRAFPNPTSGQVTLDWPTLNGPFDYQVVDVTGRQVLHEQSTAPVQSLDLSAQPSGVYLIKLQSKDAQHTLRLVRE